VSGAQTVAPTRAEGPLGLWAVALAVAAVAAAAVWSIPVTPATSPAFQGWLGSYDRLPSFLTWVLADATDAQFHRSALGAGLMLAGAAVAHWAYRRGRRWRGFDVGCGSGLWPWLTASALLSILAANLVWGWVVPATGAWQPLFVAFVSVAPAVVLCYGPGWPVALTGAAIGAGIATPTALLVHNGLCVPLGLSSLVAATTGMWAGGLLGFALCRRLPWMPPFALAPKPGPMVQAQGPVWALRRMLADFTEAPFHGNELASAGLLAGLLIGYLLDPSLPVYGTGLLPQVLAAQVLTAAVAVAVWRRRWARHGWYPTFVPIVSVAPAAVLAAGGSTASVIAGALVGAVVAPPLAAALAARAPAHCHPYVGYVMAMTLCGLTVVPLIGALA
jgi:hypothetical protein